MSSAVSNASQSVEAFSALKTGTGQFVVKGAAADDLQVGAESDGAILFQMPSASQTSDGLVLLQIMGGRAHVPADPSLGVVLRDDSAAQAPFLKVPSGDGFALGTPDKGHWLSVSAEGKLVFSKLTSPGASETFTIYTAPGAHGHDCCGPSLRSKTMWDDVGHRSIVEQAISCLRNPVSPTWESERLNKVLGDYPTFSVDLFKGLREADYNDYLDDKSVGITYYTSHFYDPDTGKNYWGQDTPNALERGSRYFKNSWEAPRHGMPWEAPAKSPGEALGIALHYFTDLTQPMHSANIANVYGDHSLPRADWRHSRYEDFSERIAKAGDLFKNYPRLTAEDMSLEGINRIEDLYISVARRSKQVWLQYVKPIYERKGDNESWGGESWDALWKSIGRAPVDVAKFLLYWTRHRFDSSS